MSDKLNVLGVGQYLGTYFLELPSAGSQPAAVLSWDAARPQAFALCPRHTPGFTPFPVELYEYSTPETSLSRCLQAVGHGVWLSNQPGPLGWAATPSPLGWHEEAGKVLLTCQTNGTTYAACYAPGETVVEPNWHAAPPAQSLLRLVPVPLVSGEQRASFPSLEEIQSGKEFSDLDFKGASLIKTDLSNTRLPRAIFNKAALYQVVFVNAHLNEAQFKFVELSAEPVDGPIFSTNHYVFTNFTGANLCKAEFSDAKARRCLFNKARLQQANFWQAQLANADFTEADLSGTSFKDAKAESITLTEALLTGTDFTGAELRNVDFSYLPLHNTLFNWTKLEGAQFRNCVFTRSGDERALTFSNANLRHTNFDNAQAIGSRFNWSNLEGASLRKAQLAKADFGEAVLVNTNFAEADLSEAVFAQATLNGTCFDRSTLLNVSFSHRNMLNVSFSRAKLTDAQFEKARLTEENNEAICRFDYAELTRACFKGAFTSFCRFDGAIMRQAQCQGGFFNWANFNGADLSNADFSGATLWNAQLYGTLLINTILNNCDFKDGANFTRAIMRGVSITDVTLTQAQFQNCVFTPDEATPLTNFDRSELFKARFDNVQADRCRFAFTRLWGASFRGAKLRKTDFGGANLDNADFSGADLTGTTVLQAKLVNTNFSNSHVPGGNFHEVKDGIIDNVTFREANLQGANFSNCKFTPTAESPSIFKRAQLQRATFAGAQANRCFFDWANLQEANFQKASLVGADLGGADLTSTDFSQADLSSPDKLRETILLEAVLHGTKFRASKLTKTNFRPVRQHQLTNVDFTEATLLEANFQGCTFIELPTGPGSHANPTFRTNQFRSANMRRVIFEEAQASRCDFTEANLQEANFKNAKLQGADFTGADLSGAHFEGADLTGAILHKASLEGAVFDRQTVLDGVDFSQANLRTTLVNGAKFKNAILTATDLRGTNLTGADLGTATAAAGQLPLLSRDPAQRTNFTAATVSFQLLGLDWRYLNLTNATVVHIPTQEGVWQLENLQAEAAILDGMDLNRALLRGARLGSASLRRTLLTNANLDYARMDSATLDSAKLIGASLANVDLSKADLSHADLTGVEFYGTEAKLAGATMLATVFVGAYLAKVDFSGIKDRALQNCNFSYACLLNADFSNTVISSQQRDDSSFNYACLHGATFEGASLFGVSLVGASVATAAGELLVTTRTLQQVPLEYEGPTLLTEEMTNSATLCPAGSPGPCTAAQLQYVGGPATAWSSPRLLEVVATA